MRRPRPAPPHSASNPKPSASPSPPAPRPPAFPYSPPRTPSPRIFGSSVSSRPPEPRAAHGSESHSGPIVRRAVLSPAEPRAALLHLVWPASILPLACLSFAGPSRKGCAMYAAGRNGRLRGPYAVLGFPNATAVPWTTVNATLNTRSMAPMHRSVRLTVVFSTDQPVNMGFMSTRMILAFLMRTYDCGKKPTSSIFD